MKILRIFIKGPNLRWTDMPVPDATNMVHWTKCMEQQGCIIGEDFMVPRESMDYMVLLQDGQSAAVVPFPKPVA